MADELFAGFNPSTPSEPPKTPGCEVPVVPVSDSSSLLNFWNQTTTTVTNTAPSSANANEAPSVPGVPVVPVPDALLNMIAEAEKAESMTPPVDAPAEIHLEMTPPIATPVYVSIEPPVPAIPSSMPSTVSEIAPIPVVVSTPPAVAKIATDPRLETFIQDDPIYQDMLRTLDLQRIRLSLAIRYLLLMFAIFLVFAWIVNNRVIMFGFSEFVWLARIRDGLFGVMAGLFSATLWYGSPVWFHNIYLTIIVRIISLVFFVGVLSALYFPLV